MRRWTVIALAACACLQPGKPNLDAVDTDHPSVFSVQPAPSDGGITPWLAGDPITVVFDDEMDPYSLRPGISVQKESTHEEQDLTITNIGRVDIGCGCLDKDGGINPTACPQGATCQPTGVCLDDFTHGPVCNIDEFREWPHDQVRYEVIASPVETFTSGTLYRLTLRTLLSDRHGNPLAEEMRVFFKVQ